MNALTNPRDCGPPDRPQYQIQNLLAERNEASVAAPEGTASHATKACNQENDMNRSDELLEQMTEIKRRKGSESRTPMSPLGQVTLMKDILQAQLQTERFNIGDILIHKFPEQAINAKADQPVIFLGYLDAPIDCSKLPAARPEDITTLHAAFILDCRIGTIRDGSFIEYLMPCENYKPNPDFPRE